MIFCICNLHKTHINCTIFVNIVFFKSQKTNKRQCSNILEKTTKWLSKRKKRKDEETHLLKVVLGEKSISMSKEQFVQMVEAKDFLFIFYSSNKFPRFFTRHKKWLDIKEHQINEIIMYNPIFFMWFLFCRYYRNTRMVSKEEAVLKGIL